MKKCDFMKRKTVILLISFFAVISGTILIFLLGNTKYPDARYDKEDIHSIVITIEHPFSRFEFSTNTFTVTSENSIETVLNAIKSIRRANRKRLYIESPSASYSFEYKFKNGKSSKITHVVYPNSLGDPLSDIWALDEVMEQVNPFFTVNVSDIKVLKIFKIDNQESIKKYIMADDSLPEIISYCRQIVIKSKGLLNYANTPFGISFNSEDGVVLCSLPFNASTPHLDDICNASAKLKTILEDWGVWAQDNA